MKADSLVATLKKLETIRGVNQLSVAPALTVNRFLTVVQGAHKLEHNLAFTKTNGDQCGILSMVFSLCAKLENGVNINVATQYFRL